MLLVILFFFFFNDTATTEIYTLSLHDALPILAATDRAARGGGFSRRRARSAWLQPRSEEHTSELQSRQYLVCRLLLEKKKNYYCRSACSPRQLYLRATPDWRCYESTA